MSTDKNEAGDTAASAVEDRPATTDDLLRALRRIEARLSEQSAAALGRESAANFLGVSTATLDRLTNAGKVKSVRVSEGRVCWRRVDLEKYLAELAE
jgi:phage host-nuclease inhibitor protein Gam